MEAELDEKNATLEKLTSELNEKNQTLEKLAKGNQTVQQYSVLFCFYNVFRRLEEAENQVEMLSKQVEEQAQVCFFFFF